MSTTWYRKKWFEAIIHVAVWVLLFLLPFLLHPNYQYKKPVTTIPINNFVLIYVINFLTWIGVFYLNAFVLVPRFINQLKYKAYGVSLIILTGILLLINWVSFHFLIPGIKYQIGGFLILYMFPCLFFLASSIVYKMLVDRVKLEQVTKEKENENLKTELSFLRSQVSPHFMFNVLNNMVALARKKSDLLEPSLIKLSSLLRYMLYETVDENVPLDKEVEYLQSYIDLQQQRFGKNVKVETNFRNADKSYFIEPMLLIPFVENAFKHGTGMIEDPFILIQLQVLDQMLHFKVSNRYNGASNEIKDRSSGIGLANVRRRLELLYGKNQHLEITKSDGVYTTSLQIKLH